MTFAACQKDMVDDSSQLSAEPITLSLNLAVEGMSAGTAEAAEQTTTYSLTRSTLGTNDPSTTIQNLWIAQFGSDGKVVGTPQYFDEFQKLATDLENSVESIDIALIPSGTETNTLVYIANTFDDTITQSLGSSYTIDQFKALTYAVTDEKSIFGTADDTDYYSILYGEITQAISSSTTLATCTLKRNIAKVNINIVVTSGVDLTFSEAVVRGVPNVSSYFPVITAGENFPADDTFSYINYESMDITTTTETTDLTFYAPVNMRGTSVSDSEQMKNQYGTPYCTSISLLAESGGENYLYTFYLGADLESDYNIEPNKEYTYTLTFNTVGDPDTDLRIEEAGGIDYSLSTMARSNCYILNPSAVVDSEYIIPIDRIDEFWGDNNYNTENITGNTLTQVGDNWEAVILWHDHTGDQTYDSATDQIGGFKLEADHSNNTVKVTLPKEFAAPTNHCNVVFVVRKKDDATILWSWHLWITDYDPYPDNLIPSLGVFQYNVDGGELHRYNNTCFNTGIYSDKLIMDRHIGARSSSVDGYGLSGASFVGPGTLFYQFGRNIPFPIKSYDYKNGYTRSTYSTSGISFAESVQIPNRIPIHSTSTNWCSESDAQNALYIWNDYNVAVTGYTTGKSIFDPSPWGFRIPINGSWGGFSGGSAENEYNYPDSYNCKLVYNIAGTTTTPYNRIYKDFAFYPAIGILNANYGGTHNTYSSGFVWSATPYSASAAYYFGIDSSGVGTSTGYSRAISCAVRPVQE